jgi:hypothetical protein
MKPFGMPTVRRLSWGFGASLAVAITLAFILPEPVAKVDSFPIRIAPIVIGAFISIPVWAPVLMAARGAASVQGVFICMCSALVWGISGASIYWYLNIKLDELPPRSETLVVDAKHLVARSSTPRRLRCLLGVARENVELAVSHDEYALVQVGDRFTVSVHDGAFGLRWISSYTRLRSNLSLNRTRNSMPPTGLISFWPFGVLPSRAA